MSAISTPEQSLNPKELVKILSIRVEDFIVILVGTSINGRYEWVDILLRNSVVLGWVSTLSKFKL